MSIDVRCENVTINSEAAPRGSRKTLSIYIRNTTGRESYISVWAKNTPAVVVVVGGGGTAKWCDGNSSAIDRAEPPKER